MRIRLVAGRVFNSHDNEKAPPVALVNQNVVRRFWPGQNPLGRKLWVGTLPNAFEVVGVVTDTKNNGLFAQTLPEVMMPFPQLTVPYLAVSFRAADPGRLAAVARQRIALVDRDLPVTEVKTMDDVLESLTTQRRFTLLLFGTFSGLAFLLAMVGLYGIVAYSVARRTEELGIRLALGAARADILRLVVWEGLTLTAAGIIVGVIGSLASNRLLRAWLYETSARDPLTLAASALLFTAVALAASYWPARRATRIDPVAALRAE
jgi:predicted permease